MDEKTYDEFISAVDVVCGNCIERSEDMCENCPVRHSVDYFNKKQVDYAVVDTLDSENDVKHFASCTYNV